MTLIILNMSLFDQSPRVETDLPSWLHPPPPPRSSFLFLSGFISCHGGAPTPWMTLLHGCPLHSAWALTPSLGGFSILNWEPSIWPGMSNLWLVLYTGSPELAFCVVLIADNDYWFIDILSAAIPSPICLHPYWHLLPFSHKLPALASLSPALASGVIQLRYPLILQD